MILLVGVNYFMRTRVAQNGGFVNYLQDISRVSYDLTEHGWYTCPERYDTIVQHITVITMKNTASFNQASPSCFELNPTVASDKTHIERPEKHTANTNKKQ